MKKTVRFNVKATKNSVVVFKLIWLLSIVFILSLVMIGTRKDEEISQNIPKRINHTQYYDEANVLSSNTKKYITEMNYKYEDTGLSNEFVVAVIKDLKGLSFERYANVFFNNWGIGEATDKKGILLMILLDDDNSYKSVRLELGNGIEEVFTAAQAGRLLDKHEDILREDNFDSFVINTIQSFNEETGILTGEFVVPNNDTERDDNGISFSGELPGFITILLLPLFLAITFLGVVPGVIAYAVFVVVIIILLIRAKKRNPRLFNDLLYVVVRSSGSGSSSSSGSSISRRTSSRKGGGSSSGGGASRSR